MIGTLKPFGLAYFRGMKGIAQHRFEMFATSEISSRFHLRRIAVEFFENCIISTHNASDKVQHSIRQQKSNSALG